MESRQPRRVVPRSRGTAKGISEEPMTNTLTYAELSTILAALRLFQHFPAQDLEQFEGVDPLDEDEIDSLCERLNCGEIVSISGGPKG